MVNNASFSVSTEPISEVSSNAVSGGAHAAVANRELWRVVGMSGLGRSEAGFRKAPSESERLTSPAAFQSYRSVVIGSIRAARRVGK